MSDMHLICCSQCFRPWKTGGCDTLGCDGHLSSVPASKVVTYTRQDESGASPRAAGFEQEELLPARSAEKDNVARIRHDKTEPADRVRWGCAA